jgi:hypothetical protein
MRIASSGLLLFFMVFCGFGYLHTYEPNPPDVQLRWRIIYGSVAGACLFGIVWLTISKSKPRE